MRNILVLTHAFPPDNTPAAARPQQLQDYLPQHGYQAIVVTAAEKGNDTKDPFVFRTSRYNATGSVKIFSALLRHLERHFSPYNDRLPWLPHAMSVGSSEGQKNSIKAIYSTSPFVVSHLAAYALKLKLRVPWIADFQDPIRDNPFRTRRWVYPYDAFIERLIFSFADHLIANTDTVAAAWKGRYPHWANKISVLWNCYDPLDTIAAAEIPSRPYRELTHIGSLYGERHPGLLFSTLERLGTRAGNVRVRLIGPIEPRLFDRWEKSFAQMKERGILKVESELLPRSEALRIAAESDCLLLLDLNAQNASFQVPSKLLEYIRIGRPILAYTPKDSPVQRILEKSGVSFTAVSPGTVNETADEQVAHFLRFTPDVRLPSPWFLDTFSVASGAKTLAATLDRLLSDRHGMARTRLPAN